MSIQAAVTVVHESDQASSPQGDLKSSVPSLRLERKHPLAIRWMHWVNFPVLFTMIWSGILIYWNDSDNAYSFPHRVYRIGLGKVTLFRFFPDWFYKWLHVPYHVTMGLSYHFFFMWIFALNGVAWVLYTWLSGEWRLILPQGRSFGDAIQVTLVDLHLRKSLPSQTKYNGAQRIAYTSCALMGAVMLLTGLAIYKPTQLHWCGSVEVRCTLNVQPFLPQLGTVISGIERSLRWLEARHTAEQIVNLLRQVEVGVANGKTLPQACKEPAIVEQTYYRWRRKYSGLKVRGKHMG